MVGSADGLEARPSGCALQHALDRVERCPAAACPFWEGDRCVLAAIGPELETTPGLADSLLGLRRSLTGRTGWSPFRRVTMPRSGRRYERGA